MYYLTVKTDFAAAHALRGYDGRCANLHGHNFTLDVTVKGSTLDGVGMLIDFVELKRKVSCVLEEFDHRNLSEHPALAECNATAEHIARYVCDHIACGLPDGVRVHSVTVHETERACATYMPGEDPSGRPPRGPVLI
ncbi:6-carboxytetrahydropterin synthase QueD [Planctomycetota bacterium]